MHLTKRKKLSVLGGEDAFYAVDGTIMPLGFSQAIAEKDGWVYLANQQKGMRVLDLDPVYLKLYCEDGEFSVSRKFCTDYYPALGEKTITLEGRDWTWIGFLKAPARVKLTTDITTLKQQGITVRAEGNQTCPNSTMPCSTFADGYARFYVDTSRQFTAGVIELKFEIDLSSITGWANQLLNTSLNWYKTSIRLNVRHNGNVTLDEVLKGEAVFVFDDTTDTNRHGAYRQNDTENNKRFYYVQEMLNQVVPRKRTLTNPANTNTYTYSLIDEDGRYDIETSMRLMAFKHNFNLGVNTRVGSYAPGRAEPYDSNDDTSPIFRKLMEDYGKRQTGTTWLVGGTGPDSWLHKVVDKDTLIKSKQRVPLPNEQITAENADVLINNTAGNTRNDTGLYELYKNVVERFVEKMIERAEHYSGARGTAGVDAPTNQWISRTGQGPGPTNPHGPGMSYSYGGIDSIATYNHPVTGVSQRRGPNRGMATPENYRGNADQQQDGIPDDRADDGDPAGTQRWPGMEAGNVEYNRWNQHLLTIACDDTFSAAVSDHQNYPAHWAGLDCASFVQRVINESDPSVTTGITDVPSISTTVMDLADSFMDYRNGFRCRITNASTGERAINIPRAWVEYFFTQNNAERRTHYVEIPQLPEKPTPEAESARVRMLRLLRRGDLLQYPSNRGVSHVAIVHSNKAVCANPNSSTTCTYEIIHAYGEPNADINGDRIADEFTRKVLITPNRVRLPDGRISLSNPTGFGRIKLWD